MNGKTSTIIQIVIWGLVLAILICIFAFASTNSGFVGLSFGDWGNWSSYNTVLQSDEKDVAGINEIAIDVSAADVNIYASDSGNFKIVQLGKDKDMKHYPYTIEETGTTLSIKEEGRHGFVGFGFNLPRGCKYEIYIPKDYNKGLTVKADTGNMSLKDSFNFNRLNLDLDAGNLKMPDTTTADYFTADVDTGDVRIGTLETQTYSIELDAGNLEVKSLSGDGEISTDAGNVDIGLKEVPESVSCKADVGNIDIRILSDFGFEFIGHRDVGDINTYFDTTRNEGKYTGTTGNAPYAKITAQVDAGKISVTKKY